MVAVDTGTITRMEHEGIAFECIVAGEGEDLVLLHGSGPGASAGSNWNDVIPVLAQHYRVIAPTLIGFSGSLPEPAQAKTIVYGMDLWIAQIRTALTSLDVTRAHFIGNSMGGAIALRLAATDPAIVASLVMMGSTGVVPTVPLPGLGRLRTYEPSLENTRALMADVFLFDSSKVTDELVRERHERIVQPGVFGEYHNMFHEPRHKTGILATDPDLVAAVEAPVLCLHGRNDQVMPAVLSIETYNLIPGSELHIVPECGHWVQIEQRATFLRVVHAFLDRVSVARG